MQKEISSGIILYNDQQDEKQFLILKYPGGHWDFVKGKMENSEDPKETAIRETKEETGIMDIEYIDGFKDKISYSFYIGKNEINKEVIFFLGKTETTTIKISHEHLDFAWLDFKSALERVTYNNAKNVLTKANNLLQDRI